jgi:hypothetical protein
MTSPVILAQTWYCPNCPEGARTYDGKIPHHVCPKIGLMVPLLREGQRSKLEFREREDMINGDDVQMDANNRPIMSTVVTTDDTQATTVYAPLAHGSIRGED